MDELEEPLSEVVAKQFIRRILETGDTRFASHAEQRMQERNLSSVDVVNVLRAGVVAPAEHENGSWRYRVRTPRIEVVIAFRSSTSLVVVSAWRTEP